MHYMTGKIKSLIQTFFPLFVNKIGISDYKSTLSGAEYYSEHEGGLVIRRRRLKDTIRTQ